MDSGGDPFAYSLELTSPALCRWRRFVKALVCGSDTTGQSYSADIGAGRRSCPLSPQAWSMYDYAQYATPPPALLYVCAFPAASSI